jgi:8-oxo-dGTP pyrophosphatase MutT (NUDIX family)
LEPGETIERCALRELEEESGLIADPSSLKRMGFLVFKLLDSKIIMRVHVYESWTFQGSEVESDEMRPKWFREDDLPFNQMWQDDKHWLPLLLRGQSFVVGRFEYEDEDTLTTYEVKSQ